MFTGNILTRRKPGMLRFDQAFSWNSDAPLNFRVLLKAMIE